MRRNEVFYSYQKGENNMQSVSQKLFNKRVLDLTDKELRKVKNYMRKNIK